MNKSIKYDFSRINNLSFRILKGENVTEEDVRQTFNFDLQNFVNQNYNISFEFKNEELTELGNGKIGRIDSRFGSLIIEYKKPNVILGKNQHEQLIQYLKSYEEANVWGVLTNGKEIQIYQFSDESKKFELNKKYSGELNEIQLLYICRIIAKKDNLILNSTNVNNILGIKKHKEIIKKLYHKMCNSDKTKTKLLYNEWQKLFNLSGENDFSNNENRKIIRKFYSKLLEKSIESTEEEYKALFCIQTYYSIILKLLLLKLIMDEKNEKISNNSSFKKLFTSIENNEIYRKLNIANLVDGDFFSWYLDELDEEELSYFYNIINKISYIESNGLNLLMIHFYENVFPFHVRRAMGEFYTPNHLAKKVVDEVIKLYIKQNNEKPKTFLDPCCGSGIFVLNALQNNIKNSYGIDINPIAVLTAKINFLLNTSLIPEEMTEIPIYLGDSTYFPKKIVVNNIECYSYELMTSFKENSFIPFTIPTKLIETTNFFEILDEIETQIKELNKQGAVQLLESYPEAHYKELENTYKDLLDRLINLEERHLNSIWLKIIGNFLKSGNLVNIDIIAGNPPWVKWGDLPDNYSKKIKEFCRIDGIFSRDKNSGGVDLNIAVLICFISIRERLNKEGKIGFLMPDTILFNKSYEGFRNYRLNEEELYYLEKVERWDKVSEKPFYPVTLPFSEYYFSLKKTNEPVIYSRKDATEKIAFKNKNSFNNHYIISDIDKKQEIMKILGNNKLKFRSGISLIKGGYYLLEFVEKKTDATSLFQAYEPKNGRIKLSEEIIELENEIVFPYIKAPQINDNEIKDTNKYCIFPYPFNSKQPYSLQTIREKFPKFYHYFMQQKIQKSIKSSSNFNQRIQNNAFDLGIFRVGYYTYGKHFLICRDNTKSSFAKVNWIKTPWGEKKLPLFDGHVNYIDLISFKKEYGKDFNIKIRDDLFNIFIQNGVKYYIEASSDSRSISSRLYNDIDIIF